MMSASGVKHAADLEGIYYTPNIHVQLLSLGKLEGQGWDIRLKNGGMELQDWYGDLFAIVSKANNVYLMELRVMAPGAEIAAWMGDGWCVEPTHQEIVEHLNVIVIAATARGGMGSEASLMTWHCQLGHLSFKMVVELARSGVSRMVIMEIPLKIPGLDACVACMAGRLVHSCSWCHITIFSPFSSKESWGCELGMTPRDKTGCGGCGPGGGS